MRQVRFWQAPSQRFLPLPRFTMLSIHFSFALLIYLPHIQTKQYAFPRGYAGARGRTHPGMYHIWLQ